MKILDQWEIDVKWELKHNGYHPSNLRLSTAIAIIRKQDDLWSETLALIVKKLDSNTMGEIERVQRQTREEVKKMLDG